GRAATRSLHPLWVMFGVLAGGALFGFVGVLLAVPACAVIGVLVRSAMGPLQAIAALRRRHGLTRDPADRASLRAGPGTARHRPTSRSPAVANVPGERDASRWRQMARPSPARRLTCAHASHAIRLG